MSKKIKALTIWEDLAAMRKEVTGKLMKIIPDAELLDVEVKKVEISPADTKRDFEDLEMFLSLDLYFYLKNITSEQITELLRTGSVKIVDLADEKWYIEYTTSYNFEFDEEIEKVSEGSFSEHSMEE